MNTELLFYKDAYLKEVDATVLEVRGNAVVLDKTIFYAESGGQPGDRGSFGPYQIVDTQKDKDGEFLHILKKGDMPSVGDTFNL
ncbi:MAG: alanyl-tRNA editing protein, partial [Spirochaetales bacterium]|nr:alanyl-tRNA editing protein [Spirochaetales bacterium]